MAFPWTCTQGTNMLGTPRVCFELTSTISQSQHHFSKHSSQSSVSPRWGGALLSDPNAKLLLQQHHEASYLPVPQQHPGKALLVWRGRTAAWCAQRRSTCFRGTEEACLFCIKCHTEFILLLPKAKGQRTTAKITKREIAS